MPAARTRGQEVLVAATQKAISGGSRETEVNEFAARPAGAPVCGSMPVMATTPVAKCPSTARIDAGSGVRAVRVCRRAAALSIVVMAASSTGGRGPRPGQHTVRLGEDRRHALVAVD